jgi:fructose 1,6-bisphosphatase
MDFQDAFNIALTLVGTMAGYLLKSVWEAIKDLQTADLKLTEKVGDMEVLVAGQYMKREDMNVISRAIFEKLDKIDEKLDSKVSIEFCSYHHKGDK